MAVWSISRALPALEAKGLVLQRCFKNYKAGYNGAVLKLPRGEVPYELLEPSSPRSFLVRFLRESRTTYMHHITFYVEDLGRVRRVLRSIGIEPHPGHPYEVLVHPKDGAILFQFFEDRGKRREKKQEASSKAS
jgi:hypothetical protein